MIKTIKTLAWAFALCWSSLSANADGKNGIIYLTSPASYQVLSVSPNGQWACGVYYDESASASYGFRWNLTNDKLELLGGQCEANSITNDGTVAGAFYSNEYTSTGRTIEVPGTWKDGQWTALGLPNSYGSWAQAITPDGRFVTGDDNKYNAYIWTDGSISSTFKVRSGGCNMAYCISPDGTMVGGWSYYHDDNRNPGYWSATDGKFHDLEPEQPGSPWQAVKKFSSDSQKMLYWGGYHIDPAAKDKGYGIHAIYDLEKDAVTTIYPINDDPFNFDLFDMNGDGTIVVGYEQNGEGTEQAIIWNNGTTQYIEQYLKERGANFDDFGMMEISDEAHYICRACCVSSDAKVFAVLYYDETYEYHTMIVELDQQMEMTSPVNIEAKQVRGLKVADINWHAPLGNKATLKGYNLYRNGTKVNADLLGSTSYYDKELANGTYTYTVSAVYEEGESEQSDAATVTIADAEPQAPQNVLARQKGYDALYTTWDQPQSNLTPCNYTDEVKAADGMAFGGGSVSFESGVRFPAEQMNLYDGYRLTAVSFYPLSEQASWLINVYTYENDELTSLGSFPVTQELEYGALNTVVLPRQITLQKNHDLVIGVQTNISNPSYSVQMVFEGYLVEGYSDLIRMTTEKDFYSINRESPVGGYDIAWGTTALLAPAGVNASIDDVKEYNVYADNKMLGSTDGLSYQNSDLAEGSHAVAVEAVYADGRKAMSKTVNVTVTPNTEALKAITPEVTNDGNKVTAKWSTPQDDDATVMGFCADTPGSHMPKASESATQFIARVDFTPEELLSYDGYNINSVSFYPMGTAVYDIVLYADTEEIWSTTVDDAKIGKWNTLELDLPVEIVKNCTYHYLIYCYDAAVGEAPLGVDNNGAITTYSDLYQTEGDEDWYSIANIGIEGNWMMRMNIAEAFPSDFAVRGYDVFFDGEKIAAGINETTATHTLDAAEGTSHKVRVDAHYVAGDKVVTGNTVAFTLVGDGIEDVVAAKPFDNKVFNLQGQRTSIGRKGVYIFDGKKVVK